MDPKEIVKAGYNAVGGIYSSIRHETLPEMSFLPEFCRYIPQNGKVLDLGCGGGIPFTKYLSEKFEVVGIDISPKQIQLAKKNVPKAVFMCKDMAKLDFPDEFFDAVLAYYSIIHVPREEHFPLFTTMFRILKPNGITLMSLHSEDDPQSIFTDYFGTTMYWSGFDGDTYISLLKKANFTIIWSKLVRDSLDENSKHLFVLVQKQVHD
ncbi:MAG: class I SAM-dependent methyltransferase [Candidatus Lokiarchaeota archaeon]|nr:class I SAM-dependent methyltransferase [Candidatus Lokiarchaeota archaeon]